MIKDLEINRWTVPLALLFACVMAYAPLISRLGLYADHWFIAWHLHFLGSESFIKAFSIDRPVLGWIFLVTTSIFGETLFSWQIFGILTRWIMCVSFWCFLIALWPQWTFQIAMVSLLFAVYPGFGQQPLPFTWANWFPVYSLFLSSLASMLAAFRIKKWFWFLYVLSIVLASINLFSWEYLFGVELIRPLLLWILFIEIIPQRSQRIMRVIQYWIPYLTTTLIFLAFRMTHPTPRGEITLLNNLANHPILALKSLMEIILNDAYETALGAWLRTFELSQVSKYPITSILFLCTIVLISSICVFIYLLHLKGAQLDSDISSRKTWAIQASLVGIVLLMISGIPIWVSNLHIALDFPWDRFTLIPMIGACLLFGGLLELFSKSHWFSVLVVAVLVGLACGWHYRNALAYTQEWQKQKEFFWQLTWRVPAIEPGTILLTTDFDFDFNQDDSLTAPLNWIYAPDNHSKDLTYLFYNVETRMSQGLPQLTKERQVQSTYRLLNFSGSLSQSIGFVFKPPACLRILDPVSDGDAPVKSKYLSNLLPFSRTELILPTAHPPAQPPEQYFGTKPALDWCYYYEKADLARQLGNWQEVAYLGDQSKVMEKSFSRNNVVEVLPFIEGYAHIGEWSKAEELSSRVYQTWEKTQKMICATWKRLEPHSQESLSGTKAFDQINAELECQGS